MSARTLRLFDAYGIELEYMIVDAHDLRVRPITDQLLHHFTGAWVGDYEEGAIGWSNELVLHVVEFKTNGPSPTLTDLPARFTADLAKAQAVLDTLGARLLPTAMHPFMDPTTETRLWPHDHNPVYEKFDAIFDCRGHGWSNLQSMHVNLPFAGDEEFGRLHAAIRMLLPLLPALAASSPLVEGRATAFLDNRMEFYRHNARRVPRVSGQVVPEPAATRAQYEAEILQPIYDDLAALDPEAILRYEWVNARGCIARFDRNAIEIRVLDLQEIPRADVAIAALVSESVRALCEGRGAPREAQDRFATDRLAAIFRATLVDAERTRVDDLEYLRALGIEASKPLDAAEVWHRLLDASTLTRTAPLLARTLEFVLERGSLARRIVRATGPEPSRARIVDVYRRLADGLLADRLFDERELGDG